jgi:hypothetical protein
MALELIMNNEINNLEANMSEETNKDLVLAILQRLSDLEARYYAMAEILNHCVDTQTQRYILWRPMIAPTILGLRADEIFQKKVFAKFANCELQVRAQPSHCPDGLALLASVLNSPLGS